ncbi:MAG TPA: T9SS type A sorting domain-containing protein, partial [Chitinophagales bacterium]|nr:T9SS type A sorting domain-containing protein [Chitinophagales bacterium]
NPASKEFRLTYALENESHVVATLYDVMGVKITELINEKEIAGKQSRKFSLKETGISSGIYLLKISMEGIETTQKIVFTE